MDDKDLFKQINTLQEKLNKAQRQAAGLKEKSKFLEKQYDDSKTREQNTNELVMELLERQRELNVMLNRTNIMLSRTQEAMAMTSLEFNEMAKALPEPKKAEWSDRITKINDLFKKTGIQDAEVVGLESSNPQLADSFSRDEMKKESEDAFGKDHTSIWDRKEQREPPRVEAEIVDEDETSEPQHEESNVSYINAEVTVSDEEPEEQEDASDTSDLESMNEDDLLFPPRKKSWWQKIAG